MLKCSFPDCRITPEFQCNCSIPSTYLCSFHTNEHMSNTSLSHTMSSSYIQVALKDKPQLLSLINYQIETAKSIKSSLLDKANIVQKSLNSLLSFFIEFERKLKNNLKEVKNKNRFLMFVSFGKFLNEQRSNLENFKLPKKFLDEISQVHEVLNSFQQMTSKIFKDFDVGGDEINHELFFVISESENLKFFNKTNKNVEDISIPNMNLRRAGAAVCDSGDGKVFVYGGDYRNEYLGDAFLIDINKNFCERLQTGIKRRMISAEFFNKKFYVFGGYSGFKLSESSYLDISTKLWVNISPLPSITYNTSTLLINSNILVAGINIDFCIYNTTQNQYYSVNPEIKVEPQNVLLKFKDQIILITKTKAYRVNLEFSNSSSFGINSNFGTVSNKPIVLENKGIAYFADYHGAVYMINCLDLQIREVVS